MSDKHLIVEGLSIEFDGQTVVHNLSFTLAPGKTLALVGESGSGKSVTARSLIGLAGAGARVTARTLSYGGQDLLGLSERGWRRLRGKGIGFVLQDALVSLDPLRPVGKEILEVLKAHNWGDRRSRAERVIELLDKVGVPQPRLRARQRPDQLSGGLRQRALIASALALSPGLVIADEPTTALDATVQAQILEVLQEIKARGDSLLIISHDLAVVAQLADEVLVLRHGVTVEQGPMQQVLRNPRHPYTRALLDAVPAEHARGTRLSPGQPAVGSPVRRLTRRCCSGPAGWARLMSAPIINRGKWLMASVLNCGPGVLWASSASPARARPLSRAWCWACWNRMRDGSSFSVSRGRRRAASGSRKNSGACIDGISASFIRTPSARSTRAGVLPESLPTPWM